MLVSLLLPISLFLFLSKIKTLHEAKNTRNKTMGSVTTQMASFFWEESASEPGAVCGLEIHSGRNFGLRVFHWKMSWQI